MTSFFDNDAFDALGSGFDVGPTYNPGTGLPMVNGGPFGVDVGGNPYGMDLHQADSWSGGNSSIDTW